MAVVRTMTAETVRPPQRASLPATSAHISTAAHRKPLVIIGIALISLASLYGKAIAQESIHKKALKHSKSLKAGKKAFQNKDYVRAQKHFRHHLRRYKKDYDSWNYLAASYYHLGLPKKALRYLKYIYKKTKLKSFNLLYRGLALKILKKNARAIKMLKRSIDFHDKYSELATFELALLHYHAGNTSKARKWGKIYLKRHSKGIYTVKANQMLDSIELGQQLKELEGVEKPNLTEAKFKYHHLSLFNFPHFWMLQIGNEAFDFTGKRPDSGRKLSDHRNQVFGLLSNFGLGLGPFRSDLLSFWAAYTYMQKWLTNTGRVKLFLKEPSDIKYFPFRFDLLERTHRLSSAITFKPHAKVNLGFYGESAYRVMGSNQFSDPDGFAALKGTIPLSYSMLLIPWVGVSYLTYLRSFVYAYIEKNVDMSDSDFSNVTFGRSGSSILDYFYVSWGGRQVFTLKEYDISLELDAFMTQYLFNDYWLDFTRLGGAAKLKLGILSKIYLALRGGYMTDKYATDVIKLGECSQVIGEFSTTTTQRSPKPCARVDTAIMYELNGSFDLSPTKRIELQVVRVENMNYMLQEYQRTETKFKLRLTFAFPSAKKSLSYVDKFSDAVYLIGKEDYGYIR